jgi:phospholipid/cholesterol/gamma-HCH transport system substrate-binding protein
MHINLTGGSRDTPNLQPPAGSDTAEIPSRTSLFGRLDDGATDLLSSLLEATGRINLLLSEDNVGAAGEILSNSRVLTSQLSRRAAETEDLLAEARETIHSIRVATDGLPELVSQVRQTASALEAMATSLAAAGNTLQASSEDLSLTISESGADLRRFTATALPEATRTVRELRATANSLRRISETIEADPSQLVFGAPERPPGPGE